MAIATKRRKIIIFGIIGLVLAGLTLGALLRRREAEITVQTERVVRRNLTEIVVANGKIQPVTQVVISPEVAGEIVALPIKEGARVQKGDLLVQVKADTYQASRNSAEASYKSALAAHTVAKAELDRAAAEFKRNEELFQNQLVSDSIFLDYKTAYEVAKLRYETAAHQADQARFGLDKAMEDLSKTTITAPMDGTVVRLRSQLGERVLGTSFNMGTEIMTLADLDEMEARVEVGETDVVLMQPGQRAQLEVDAFKDRKFSGVVTEIANSSKTAGLAGGASQDATKFEVRIRIKEQAAFRPGMSVSAEIETRYRTNVLTVPIASVTTRLPKPPESQNSQTNSAATNQSTTAGLAPADGTNAPRTDRRAKDAPKPIEVVFIAEGDRARMSPVKIGISDDDYWEILEGVSEDQEVVSGGYKAISRELEDGKKIRKGKPEKDEKKEKP